MKSRIVLVILLSFVSNFTHGATLTWTNLSGGSWSAAANWSPNQAPATGDDIIITNAGTYSVTNASSATIGHLTLGGTNGVQTLIVSSLVLTNSSAVNSNGVFSLESGTIQNSLTIAPGGTLLITNTAIYIGNSSQTGGYLTNNGTVVWGHTNASCMIYGYGNAVIQNNGLWEAMANDSTSVTSGVYTNNLFFNAGTLEKPSGTGPSSLAGQNWQFNTTGILTTTSGSLNIANWYGTNVFQGNAAIALGTMNAQLTVASNAVFNWLGGTTAGALTVAQGGTLYITNSSVYIGDPSQAGGYLTNNGTVIWGAPGSSSTIYGYGNAVINNTGTWEAMANDSTSVPSGTYTNNLFFNSGTIEKLSGTGASSLGSQNWQFNTTGILTTTSGSLNIANWYGTNVFQGNAAIALGTMNAQLTVASNAVFNWLSGTVSGAFTVAPGGALYITNSAVYIGGSGQTGGYLTNNGTVIWGTPGGSSAIYGYGNAVIDNTGIWEALANDSVATVSPVYTNNVFINSGTIEKLSGTGASQLAGSGWLFEDTGILETATGSFSANLGGNETIYGNFNLTGSTQQGILTLASGAVVNANCSFNGSVTVASNAVLNWVSGTTAGALTVSPGGILYITNSTVYIGGSSESGGYLTNNGMVIWGAAGNSCAISGYGNVVIDNTGTWEALANDSLSISSSVYTNNLFLNSGLIEKIGGAGQTTFGSQNWLFNTTGTLETSTGLLGLGNWVGTNIFQGNASVNFISMTASLTVASNSVLNWMEGTIGGETTLALGSTVKITNSSVHFDTGGQFTNLGTVLWGGPGVTCALYGDGNVTINNAGFWQALANDSTSVVSGADTNNIFINTGIFQKTGGTSQTTLGGQDWQLNNLGVLDAQIGTISLSANYNLTGGTLNIGISSLASYGIINLGGSPAAVTGTLSANFNNGYIPPTGSTFSPVTYSSRSGIFTATNLPFPVAWQTNYGSTALTLKVLNVRPVLAPVADQSVDELNTLNVPITASDMDAGQTLTYSLVSAPQGMTIAPATGAISWTPAQTQSPGTNLVQVSVTDNGTPTLSATNSFNVIVIEINVAPMLPVVLTQTVNELTPLQMVNTATEFNIHSTTTGYSLVNPPAGMTIDTSGVITWTPAQTQSPGTNTITTIVTNSNPYDLVNPVLTSMNQFTVIVKEVNVAPALPVIATQTVDELTPLLVTNTATEFNIHSTITGYALVAPPAGMTINASGIITWTPAQTQSPATNTITTIVTNSNPYDAVHPILTSTSQFTVIVKEVNVAPALPAIATQTVNELSLLTVTNTATNSNLHSTITGYSLVNPSANMVINSNGVITWTPTQSQSPGTNTITTIVTNSNPFDLVNPTLTATNTFTVVVNEVNVVPVLPAISNQTINVQALLTVNNTASEPNIHAVVTYSLPSAPTGASISGAGVITWRPTRSQGPGTNIFTTVATSTDPLDKVNPTLTVSNSFTVITYAPTLAAISNYTINFGQTVSFTASATDNDPARTLTFSVASVPTGAAITSSGGVFTWQPTVNQAGSTNTLQVIVTDDSAPALNDTKTFSITVNPFTPPLLSIAVSANMLLFGWPTNAVNFVLEKNSNLTTTNWVRLSSVSVIITNGMNQATLLTPTQNVFYRLVYP